MDFRKLLIFGIFLFIIYSFFGLYGILGLLVIYLVFFYVYKRKYYIRVISGETGSGKSLLANHIIQKYIKYNERIDKIKNEKLRSKYVKYNIYSTFYIKGAKVLTENFYNFQYPENSVLLIDEAQIMFDSREHSKLTKQGISNKLKAMLSMHRHHRLDIYFITQRPEEVDAQIRRYSNDLLVLDKTIFFRKFYLSFKGKKLKIETKVVPIFVIYKNWANVSDYLRWYTSTNLEITPREMGAKTKIAIIFKRDYQTYNTYQDDSFYSSLDKISDLDHTNPNSLINTGRAEKNG